MAFEIKLQMAILSRLGSRLGLSERSQSFDFRSANFDLPAHFHQAVLHRLVQIHRLHLYGFTADAGELGKRFD